MADEAAEALARAAAGKPAGALTLLVQATDSDEEDHPGEVPGNEAGAAAPAATDDIEACADAAAHVIETPGASNAPLLATPPVARDWSWKLRNWCLLPAMMPLLVAWWLLALAVAQCITLTVLPSLLLARQLYYACPFIPHMWRSDSMRSRFGTLGTWLLRLQFEGAHATSVLARILTLPLRPHTPSFYILGFPKCGTTSLAAYLTQHPGISGVAGMPGSEFFAKESHFFAGILGRGSTSGGRLSRLLYRSFFPTIMTRWWSEAVLGVQRWMCFDACPTYACLPHVAARAAAITPGAKLVVMVRDPVAALFSAETMLRNMGVPLTWSLAEPLQPQDARLKCADEAGAYWRELEAMPPSAPLPSDLPQRFYLELSSQLMAGRFADRLRPWIAAFGAENILLVDYQQFVSAPEEAVRQVLDFVGAGTATYEFKPAPPRMVGDYKGRACDAATARWLHDTWFSDSNAGIAAMLAAQKAAGGCADAAAPWP